MKTLFLIFISTILFAQNPFDSPMPNNFDLSIFNTKSTKENIQASGNKKIKCRYICDKKVYKEKKIADAIFFYKKRTK